MYILFFMYILLPQRFLENAHESIKESVNKKMKILHPEFVDKEKENSTFYEEIIQQLKDKLSD